MSLPFPVKPAFSAALANVEDQLAPLLVAKPVQLRRDFRLPVLDTIKAEFRHDLPLEALGVFFLCPGQSRPLFVLLPLIGDYRKFAMFDDSWQRVTTVYQSLQGLGYDFTLRPRPHSLRSRRRLANGRRLAEVGQDLLLPGRRLRPKDRGLETGRRHLQSSRR